MSVKASVIGPEAILGSSRRACSKAGTLKPNRHAVHSDNRIPEPIASATNQVPRHVQTISPTMAPLAVPSSAAVSTSRWSALAYQRKLGRDVRRI